MSIIGRIGWRWTAAYVCIATLVVILSLFPASDPDLFIMLATGRQIAESGQIPHADTWSHTAAGRPWQMHEWLSSLAAYAVFSLSGIGGVIVLKALALALVFLAGADLARRLGASPGPTLWLSAAALLAAQLGLAERMQIFTFAGLMAVQFLWRSFQAGRIKSRTWLAAAAAIFALWANLHAGLLLGLVMLFLFWVEEVAAALRKKPASRLMAASGALLIAAAAANINPYGIHVWLEILKYFHDPEAIKFADLTGRAISEYQPLFSSGWQYKPYAVWSLIWIIASGLGMAADWKRVKPADLLLWLFLLRYATWAARYAPLFVLLTYPAAAANWSRFGRLLSGQIGGLEWVRNRSLGKALFGVSLLLAGILSINLLAGGWDSGRGGWTRAGLGWRHGGFSERGAGFMKENLGGARVFNAYRLGGFLAWHRIPVFIDGRVSMYEGVFDDYLAISSGDVSRLAKHGIDCLVLSYPQAESWSPLHRMASRDPGWTLVFWDDAMLIYVKRNPDHADLINEREYKYVNPVFPDLEIRLELFLGELARAQRDHENLLTPRLLAYQYHYRNGRLDSAEFHIREGLKLFPDYGTFHNNLGNLLLAAGRVEEAVRSYRKAIRYDAGLGSACGNLGLVYERKGDLKKAEHFYLRNIRVAPFDPWPYNRLGELAFLQGKPEKAKVYWVKGARLDPRSKAAENLRKTQEDRTQ